MESIITKLVAANIKARRNDLGLTQQAVADLVGEHVNITQRRERGKHRIGAPDLYALSIVLKCDVNYFFTQGN